MNTSKDVIGFILNNLATKPTQLKNLKNELVGIYDDMIDEGRDYNDPALETVGFALEQLKAF